MYRMSEFRDRGYMKYHLTRGYVMRMSIISLYYTSHIYREAVCYFVICHYHVLNRMYIILAVCYFVICHYHVLNRIFVILRSASTYQLY